MFSGQKPFDQWSRWVPENATGFSISSGANLHPAYAWLMEIIPQQFPETQEGLDQYERIQEQLDLHLDADLLQSFSGESVSVALPGGGASALGGSGQSVTFLRCTKPARIKELVHRLFDQLQQNPQLQSQRLSLKPVAGMDGFEEISATFLGIVGVKPVIGFHDDWMVIGTHADAVKAVLKTQAGEAASIAETDRFLQFETKIDGPVTAISYADLAANTRAMSQGLQQVGAMLPFLLAMSGQNPADLKPAEKFLALLPSAGKIIGKFDFYQSQLSVTEPGPDGLTYTRRSVTLIRPPRAAGDAGTTVP
jgi:hypothetical protein